MRPAVTAAAGQPSRRDGGSKAAVNRKRRYGKSTRTTTRARCATISKVGVGGLREDLARERDGADRAEAEGRPQKLGRRGGAASDERDEAEQSEDRRTDVPRMSLTVSAVTLPPDLAAL